MLKRLTPKTFAAGGGAWSANNFSSLQGLGNDLASNLFSALKPVVW